MGDCNNHVMLERPVSGSDEDRSSSVSLLDCPQVDGIMATYADSLFWLPIVHVEIVRYDTAPGFEFFLELGPQLKVYRGQEVHGYHIGLAEVKFKQVALYKLHLVSYACRLRIGISFRNAFGVKVHTYPGCRSEKHTSELQSREN